MDARGGAVQGAFINFFTMNPILPPEPIIDYSTEGVSKSKITSWAVIFSFLVSWMVVLIIGILAVTVLLMIVGVGEGPAFSIGSIVIEIILIPMILFFIYVDGSLERTRELLRFGSLKRGLTIGLAVPVFAMIVDNILVLVYGVMFVAMFGEPTIPELPGGTSWESSSSALILTFISICILTPISEELLFRGYILDSINRIHGKWPAILLSSLLFGLVHFDPYIIGMATIGGVIYGWIRIRTGSLIPGIVAHAMWNTMALIVTYL